MERQNVAVRSPGGNAPVRRMARSPRRDHPKNARRAGRVGSGAVAQGLSTPRGTLDVLPEEAALRDRLIGLAGEALGNAGYQRIETPMFESTELFKRGVGGSTDIVRKEMYTFEDGGGRSLTLRPEGTATVARSYIEHGMHKLPQPVKLWYSGPFFRYERAQAGRQRQFAQIGAEVLGSDAPAVDAELIAILDGLLRTIGARGIRLRLGSLGSIESRAEYRQKLQDYLRSRQDELSDDVVSRIDENPLRAFDAGDPGTQRVMETAPRLLDELAGEDADHFDEVRSLLDAVGVAYDVDPTLVRGLDYYTRTVFEFTSDALGAQSGVGGGGRYDGLLQQLGGQPAPGCGWGAGIERMLLAAGPDFAAAAAPAAPLLFVAAEGEADARRAAFALATGLQRDGHRVVGDPGGRSLKAQLKAAGRSGARYVAVVRGEDDVVLRGRGIDDRDLTVAAVPTELDRLALLASHDPHAQAAASAPSEPASPGAPTA